MGCLTSLWPAADSLTLGRGPPVAVDPDPAWPPRARTEQRHPQRAVRGDRRTGRALVEQRDRPLAEQVRRRFGAGAGEWTVSAPADGHGDTIPVAASGGWLDDRTFRAEVIFLETPHRMDITCSLPGRTAEAVWRHPPLTPSRLQHLHCPG